MDNKIVITLPDGQKKTLSSGVTGIQVASNISKNLAKSALAYSIDGSVKDLSEPINKSSELKIHTIKDTEIASGVAYLSSDISSYVNGHNLIIDGGYSAW